MVQLKKKSCFAFILEGDTEKEFYLTLLDFLCNKYSATFNRSVNATTMDIDYIISLGSQEILTKFHVVNTIGQIPQSGRWFNAQCIKKYNRDYSWTVFLCYDTDGYKEEISKFYEGDWAILRSSLKRASNIFDIAASADIEDIMLTDLPNILKFLGLNETVTLSGRKGKAKMKNLYRSVGATYHEGRRAKLLIDSLDMQYLLDNAPIPLYKIEEEIFCNLQKQIELNF